MLYQYLDPARLCYESNPVPSSHPYLPTHLISEPSAILIFSQKFLWMQSGWLAADLQKSSGDVDEIVFAKLHPLQHNRYPSQIPPVIKNGLFNQLDDGRLLYLCVKDF